jgi:hypothetical protein
MAAESIYAKRKYGFPLIKPSEKGTTTSIEYVDVTATLVSAKPDIGDTWGDYEGVVTSCYIEELENTGKSTLFVDVTYEFQAGGTGEDIGTLETVVYEIEWVMFQRSLFEHPRFEQLTTRDIVDIQKWKDEINASYRSAFQYEDKTQDPPYIELSALARLFARGVLLGQESYEDYSPVIRKTSTYVNGLPPLSEAGLKDDPPAIPNAPIGYEWRKSADRAIQTAKRNKWDKTEEWLGAVKVLSDKQEIYWEQA